MKVPFEGHCREALVLALAELTDSYKFGLRIEDNSGYIELEFVDGNEPSEEFMAELLKKHDIIQQIERNTRPATNRIHLQTFVVDEKLYKRRGGKG